MPASSFVRVGVVAAVLAAACGGEPAPGTETSAPAASQAPQQSASVTILAPADGDTIPGDSVVVRLAATGVRIVPAGDTTQGTGHHHLYLDQDLGQPGEVVPSIPGHVVHLGTGASEYVFTDVPSGEHRLIAVVADGLHVPLQPWVTDTVRFVVR
jgi:hypothetical protein